MGLFLFFPPILFFDVFLEPKSNIWHTEVAQYTFAKGMSKWQKLLRLYVAAESYKVNVLSGLSHSFF